MHQKNRQKKRNINEKDKEKIRKRKQYIYVLKKFKIDKFPEILLKVIKTF